MAALGSSIDHYYSHSLATNSLCTYRSGWSAYLRFCSSHGLHPFPPAELHLAAFASHLADRHLSHTTIHVYLAAVAFHSIRLGHSLKFDAMPQLHYVLRGIRRVQGSSLSRPLRDPITNPHMLALRSYLARVFPPHDALMLWAALTSAFFGLLRASEYCSPSPTSTSPGTLLLSHVSFDEELSAATLFLPMSKTDHFGQGVNISLFDLSSPLCPVSALHHYLSVRPSTHGPLFAFSNGDFLTRAWVVAILRVAFPAEPNLNTHSFRIGGASALAEAGIPDYTIQAMGRWSSDSFLRYIRTPRASLRSAQARMVTPPDH